jgi:hypothetical protein
MSKFLQITYFDYLQPFFITILEKAPYVFVPPELYGPPIHLFGSCTIFRLRPSQPFLNFSKNTILRKRVQNFNEPFLRI